MSQRVCAVLILVGFHAKLYKALRNWAALDVDPVDKGLLRFSLT